MWFCSEEQLFHSRIWELAESEKWVYQKYFLAYARVRALRHPMWIKQTTHAGRLKTTFIWIVYILFLFQYVLWYSLRLELSDREKNIITFVGFIIFVLFESWIGFDDFIYQTLRSIGYNIGSMSFIAVPSLVSYDINGLVWGVNFSPWSSLSIVLINIFITAMMFYVQYKFFLRIIAHFQ